MIASTLLITATLVLGQAEKPPSNFEHLKALDCFTGTWTAKVELEDGSAPYEGVLKHEWILNKNVQLVTFTVANGEGQFEFLREMRIWDVSKQQITSFTANFAGGYQRGTITIKDNQFIHTSIGIDPEGKKTSWTFVVRDQTDDSFTLEWKDRREGDEQFEDQTWVYKRVK